MTSARVASARARLGAFLLAVAAWGLFVACTPGQVHVLKTRGPTIAARVACVVLRWTTPAGFSRELCATAEEIADFGDELLAARDARPDAAPPPVVAVAVLEATRRRPARRRCAGWVYLQEVDGGARDASALEDVDRAIERVDGGGPRGGVRSDAGR